MPAPKAVEVETRKPVEIKVSKGPDCGFHEGLTVATRYGTPCSLALKTLKGLMALDGYRAGLVPGHGVWEVPIRVNGNVITLRCFADRTQLEFLACQTSSASEFDEGPRVEFYEGQVEIPAQADANSQRVESERERRSTQIRKAQSEQRRRDCEQANANARDHAPLLAGKDC